MCKVWSSSIGKDHAWANNLRRGASLNRDLCGLLEVKGMGKSSPKGSKIFIHSALHLYPSVVGRCQPWPTLWQGISHSLTLTCSLVSLEYTQEQLKCPLFSMNATKILPRTTIVGYQDMIFITETKIWENWGPAHSWNGLPGQMYLNPCTSAKHPKVWLFFPPLIFCLLLMNSRHGGWSYFMAQFFSFTVELSSPYSKQGWPSQLVSMQSDARSCCVLA